MTEHSKPDYSIQSLQRGLQILEVLLDAGHPLNLEQIGQKTDLAKSTAFRLVSNLLAAGYIVQVREGYWLSLKMLRFGAAVAGCLELKDQALPHLVQLRNRFNETVHLAVFDDDLRVVYVEKLAAAQAIGIMMSRIGSTAPPYCTGLGKAMSAFTPRAKVLAWLERHSLAPFTATTITDQNAFLHELDAIRERGYALDVGEHEVNVRCIAAPILDWQGAVVGAISIAGPDTRMPDPLLGSPMAAEVVNTAATISRALGFPS